jgi:type VI secretion system ImpH/TssG family protein
MASTISINQTLQFQSYPTVWRGDAYQLLYVLHRFYSMDFYKNCKIGRSFTSTLHYNQVHTIERQEGQWQIMISSPGLIGRLGALPLRDQKLVVNKDALIRESNSAFFDIFHHELSVRSYQSWLSHRLLLSYHQRNSAQSHRSNDFSLHSFLIHLAGSFSNRTSIDDLMVCHALLFRKKYISTASLKALLQSYFGFSLHIQNLSANYHCIPQQNLSRLSTSACANQLGQDVRLGQSIIVYQNQIRIDIGPLNFKDYIACLPGGSVLCDLKTMIEKTVPHHIEVRAKLVIAQAALPKLQLKKSYLQLGRTTWLYAGPVLEDKEGCLFSVY